MVKIKYQLGIRYMLKGKGDYKLDDKALLQQFFYEIKNRKGFTEYLLKQKFRKS